jgi:hypothetical protein
MIATLIAYAAANLREPVLPSRFAGYPSLASIQLFILGFNALRIRRACQRTLV